MATKFGKLCELTFYKNWVVINIFLQVGKNYVESVAKLFDILNNKNAVGIAPNLLLQEYMIKNFDYEQVSWYHVTKSELIYKRNFWVTNNTFAKFLNRR